MGEFRSDICLNFWSASVNSKFGEGSFEPIFNLYFFDFLLFLILELLFLVVSYQIPSAKKPSDINIDRSWWSGGGCKT